MLSAVALLASVEGCTDGLQSTGDLPPAEVTRFCDCFKSELDARLSTEQIELMASFLSSVMNSTPSEIEIEKTRVAMEPSGVRPAVEAAQQHCMDSFWPS